MIVKTKAFADRRAYIGSVGRAGENAVRALEIDCADVLAEYPDAEIIAVIRRAQGDPYTVALEKDGAVRRLVFLEADYRYPGRLEIELRAIDGDKILKSAIYAATVEESIQGESDTPGQPVRDVLDRLETEIAAAQAVVDDIRQKLDSGAFKGDKGDKGDKGEPGSDATIIPATNAEIDTHTDAAHVLAPSNMDYAVKAAMTDGKGAAWTAAEQAAARERIHAEGYGEFTLIESITLTENILTFERTTEPDGTPYNFSAMKVIIRTHPSDTPARGVIDWSAGKKNNNNNPEDQGYTKIGGGISVITGLKASDSIPQWYAVTNICSILPQYGIYSVVSASGQQGGVMDIKWPSNGNYQTSSASNKINRFDMHIYPTVSGIGNEFVSGTEIKIYGVRS